MQYLALHSNELSNFLNNTTNTIYVSINVMTDLLIYFVQLSYYVVKDDCPLNLIDIK